MSQHALIAAGLLVLLCQLAAALSAVQFAPLPAALTDATKHQVLTSATATFGNLIPTGFDLMLRTGNTPGGSTPFGQLVTSTGKPVLTAPGGKVDVSANPDFQSFIKGPDGKLYLVSQFESPQPSVIYISELNQDPATGKMTVVKTKPVDLSSIGGAWNLCAGQLSPWNTHLGGEEYEPDAKTFELATSLATLPGNVVPFMRYFDKYAADNLALADVQQYFNPYNYGHAVEVKVLAGGDTAVEKWFTLGRNAKEMVYVMPDKKTVYITDDGTNVGFFKFVAKNAGDLSSGTLYAAKFTQTSDKNGGAFNVAWIALGTSDNAALKAKAQSLKFSDMFAYQAPAGDGSCPAGYKAINANGIPEECLSVKAGAETWAAFFETRRYAATLGATTEFSKWEGITFSPKRKKIYTSMTEIRYGMEDNKKKGEANTQYDIGGPNDVRLPYNPCGCVYELDVDASYNALSMKATVCGTTDGLTDEKNVCSVESISSPDNVSVMDDHDILLIGEDTSDHQNDVVWAYCLNTGSLTRILTTPFGAESTSVYFYPSINGFAYIMAVAQHPYGESDVGMANGTYSEGTAGYVGYFAIKASDIAGKGIQFIPLPVARTDEAKSKFAGTSSLVAGTTSPAAYNTLYRSGKVFGTKMMGRLIDYKRKPIRALRPNLQPRMRKEISNSPDHTTLLHTCNSLHLVSQYEDTPGLMYVMNVQQDPNSGQLSVAKPREINFSKYGGLWYPCAGMKTQWESHLGSEEYEPDAKTLALANTLADIQADPESGSGIIAQMRYFQKYLPQMNVSDVKTLFKPYMYGRVTEAFVDKTGCYKAVKHFAMGRGSIEMALVLGDLKTVLISEDGQNDGFYKFVADKAGDLSAGTLYAAKFTQKSAENGGAFDIAWIKLGSGTDADLLKKATTLSFNDIFQLASPDGTGACPTGFTSVNAGYAGQECLKLKAGMDKVAPFLETRRYAALLGATTELNKAEGMAFDPASKKAYLSITSVEKGMEDAASKGSPSTKYDGGHPNDIRLKWNPCGCVYQLDLDAALSPTGMKALVCGQPVNATANKGNACSLEGISNPDNLDIIEGTNTLLIGEDTNSHQNDVMWTYDLASGRLTRVLSTPYGSEITSPNFYANVNGFGYILGVVQHPYGESDQDKVKQPGSTGKEAWTGYMGPFKDSGAAPAPFCNDNAGICGKVAK